LPRPSVRADRGTYPDHIEELRAENDALGSPVEILVDQPHDQVVAMVRRAGIYLHTHSLEEPYGMPISIAEAMGTGAYVIARRCDEAVTYVGPPGSFYDTDEEAADLISATAEWSAASWRSAEVASVERAHRYFSSDVVLGPLFDDWAAASLESNRPGTRPAPWSEP
jgi:glycosyltransferase involved in cell wall biosynthesis